MFNTLTSAIPTQLGLFTKMKELLAGGFTESLTGPIPTELAQISALKLLDLRYHRLNSTLPTQLGNLANLSVLPNELTGTIPTALAEISALSVLDLAANRLTSKFHL
jgi:hypothetical protein